MLAIKHFIVIGFVRGIEQPATNLRHNTNLEELIFQEKGIVLLIDFFMGKIILQGIWINHPAGTLVGLVLEEGGIGIIGIHPVGRQGDGLLPYLYGVGRLCLQSLTSQNQDYTGC